MYRIHVFLDETWCVLNEKMMPDITITVPQLDIDKNMTKTNISMDKLKSSTIKKHNKQLIENRYVD
jgi:hypothetical protein